MKKLFLSTLLLALPLLASAYDCQVDGIYYNLIPKGNMAEVTSGDNKYTGDVVIPEKFTYEGVEYSVTSIGNSAFASCTGLASVTIPNSVTSIGDSAFSGCSLISVTIPNSVTSIGSYAFEDCRSLTSVLITDLAAWCKIAFYGSTSNPLSSAHHLYLNGEEIKDLVIPNSVTTIGDWAFQKCYSLTSVTIPNSVTSIGNNAFRECRGLTSVTIPNSVTSIGDFAFWKCRDLSSVTIPNSVNSIGGSAFGSCSSLTSVTIPNSVTSIGNNAFWDCSGLTSVTIPNSVTSIGDDAFSGCSGLTSVHIKDLVAWFKIAFNRPTSNPLYYAHHLYLNGKEIKDLVISNSVTNIGNYALYGCSGLTSVTIPNSVTSIGYNAFSGCVGLTTVISEVEIPFFIDVNCFSEDVFKNSTLYVPKGTVDKYKSTDYWNKFVFIEEGEPGSGTQPDEKKCATPTISYADKRLTFSCETEGVEYVSEIKDVDIKKFYDSSINLSATYEISVYATKSGYENSDVATATLVWTNAVFTETTPETPTSAKAIAESIPMLISAQNGTITVRGEQNGLPLTVYTADGKMLGAATMKDGQASISTNLQRGEIAIVKVGSKSVKIKM